MIIATVSKGVKGHLMTAGKEYEFPAEIEDLAISLGWAKAVTPKPKNEPKKAKKKY